MRHLYWIFCVGASSYVCMRIWTHGSALAFIWVWEGDLNILTLSWIKYLVCPLCVLFLSIWNRFFFNAWWTWAPCSYPELHLGSSRCFLAGEVGRISCTATQGSTLLVYLWYTVKSSVVVLNTSYPHPLYTCMNTHTATCTYAELSFSLYFVLWALSFLHVYFSCSLFITWYHCPRYFMEHGQTVRWFILLSLLLVDLIPALTLWAVNCFWYSQSAVCISWPLCSLKPALSALWSWRTQQIFFSHCDVTCAHQS